MTSANLQLDSVAVHAGREDLGHLGVHALPIDFSTTYPLADIELGGRSYDALAGGGEPDPSGGAVYSRLWNPTVARFETALAALERTPAAVAFASGMAALTATILTIAHETGCRHVVAVRPLYGGSDHLLASGRLGTQVTFCTPTEVPSAVRDDTGLVVVETPANPTLELADIRGIAAAADGVPLLVDNTFATPVLQNPFEHGAALVLHSATKYLGGHGDVVGGVVACGEDLAAGLRRTRAVTGALLHPLGAYLLHRGLATLPLRVRAQQASAQRIAQWLTTHPAVARVRYPGIDEDRRGLLGSQLRGPGAMIAIELAGGYEQARRFTSAVRLFTHAVSLGGVDSLLQHPAALTHRPVAPEARPSAGLVRLSIGLESATDLIADLDGALAVSAPARTQVAVPA
jgi:methionine-gamma-lyase